MLADGGIREPATPQTVQTWNASGDAQRGAHYVSGNETRNIHEPATLHRMMEMGVAVMLSRPHTVWLTGCNGGWAAKAWHPRVCRAGDGRGTRSWHADRRRSRISARWSTRPARPVSPLFGGRQFFQPASRQ